MEVLRDGSSLGDSGRHCPLLSADNNKAAVIVRGPQDTSALVGDRVLLKAIFMGHPEPTVKWTRAGRLLKNDERTSITSGDGISYLLLQNITADDSGKYDICVENCLGSDCSYASVSVEGPPDPPSGKPILCPVEVNAVLVTWSSSPYDGGRIVTGFLVEYSLAGSDIWNPAITECHSLNYTVRNLQPGAKYIFRVRACNVHGFSDPGLQSDIIQIDEIYDQHASENNFVVVEPGPEFKIRYEVQEELGKGRFGVVHKVIDRAMNQPFAAKFIKCRTGKDRDKVQEEIDIMNLLQHPKLLELVAAFENPREMIMVLEHISGGELFERVVADDFTLTEKDCILFMRQICEGVAYMHSRSIVHLDLKPENIMCSTRISHDIKIIDFGLAQRIDPKNPMRVLFGTAEFVPPEIINYEPIGIESDMWSLGVICYVLLSGLSPFMGESDSETFANITRADYDFEDEAFNTVSQYARDFIGALLLKRKEDRLSAEQCLKHIWLDPENHQETVILSTDKLKKYIIRRKWQKTGNAIRALGRMATLSASRRNSANNSQPTTPRPSITNNNQLLPPQMCSLNEEDSDCDEDYKSDLKQERIVKINLTDSILKKKNDDNIEIKDNLCKLQNEKLIDDETSITTLLEVETNDKLEEIRTFDNFSKNQILEDKIRKEIQFEDRVIEKDRKACSERSDSGFSDCSMANANTGASMAVPVFNLINEEESENKSLNDRTTGPTKDGAELISVSPKSHKDNINRVLKIDNSLTKLTNCDDRFDYKDYSNQINKKHMSTSKTTPDSLKRLPMYSSQSVANTIKKFDQKSTTVSSLPKTLLPKTKSAPRPKTNLDSSDSHNKNKNSTNLIVESTISNSTKSRFRSPSPSLLRKTQSVIAKEQSNVYFLAKSKGLVAPQSPSTKRKTVASNKNHLQIPCKESNNDFSSCSQTDFKDKKIITKQSSTEDNLSSKITIKTKDQASAQNVMVTKKTIPPVTGNIKPKSESFRKAAAFWNSPK